MAYKHIVFLSCVIFFLGMILVLRPCSNGAKITVLNAYGEDISVNFYDAGWHNIIFTIKVPAHSSPVYKRVYIYGTQTYLIEVQNAKMTKIIMRGDFGYFPTPGEQSSFFMVDRDSIKFASWSYDNIYKAFFDMSLNMLSCGDNYILSNLKKLM